MTSLAAMLFVAVFLSPSATPQVREPLPLTDDQRDAIAAAVSELLHGEFARKNCIDFKCRVLVANFALRSGKSCESCRILSDAVAAELQKPGYNVEVIRRNRLQSFLDSERIPSEVFAGRETLIWLGDQLGASQVLLGVVEPKPPTVQLKIQMLGIIVRGSKITSDESRATLSIGSLAAGLVPSEPFDPQLKPPPEMNGQKVIGYEELKPGMTPPKCTYAPNPPYTFEASKAKVQGSLKIEAVVTPEGRLEDTRIVEGLAYGLNEQSLKTLKAWRCLPATSDGKPVPMLVPFEVNLECTRRISTIFQFRQCRFSGLADHLPSLNSCYTRSHASGFQAAKFLSNRNPCVSSPYIDLRSAIGTEQPAS